MDSATLKAMQAPLKDAYRNEAGKALITLRAKGSVDDAENRLQGGDRSRHRRGRAASGDRRQRHGATAPATCCWRRSSPAPA